MNEGNISISDFISKDKQIFKDFYKEHIKTEGFFLYGVAEKRSSTPSLILGKSTDFDLLLQREFIITEIHLTFSNKFLVISFLNSSQSFSESAKNLINILSEKIAVEPSNRGFGNVYTTPDDFRNIRSSNHHIE